MSDFETTSGWQGGAPADEGPARDLTGMLLGDDFRVERLLGRGGMGEVYLARQLSLDRPVALKVLKAELATNPTYLSRFEAEGTAVARLNHPNIVQVYTLGRHKDLRFIAMEYVQGTNLREYLTRKGTIDLPLALSIMRQTCQAIAAAGAVGLIHRDIKPENLLLTRKGQVKVADFGLCRDQGGTALHLTQEGVTLGTPLYMSPEQVQGKPLDHRSDLYSIGVTFYHMLAGEPPFRGNSAMATALKHLQEKPVSLAVHRPDLPPELVALVMKLLQKNPADRYSTALEVERDLARLKGIVADRRTLTVSSLPTATEAPEHPAPRRSNPLAGLGRSAGRLAWPRPTAGTLALLTLIGLIAGLARGYTGRATDLLGDDAPPPTGPPAVALDPSWSTIPAAATPRDQLRIAQLRATPADRTASLLAVPGRFPDRADWDNAAYVHLARTFLRRADDEGLDRLATALESSSSAADQTLASICRAGAAAIENRPADTLAALTATTPGPSYFEPATAELALEAAEWALDNQEVAAQAPQWTKLREDLLGALSIVPFDPAERFDPGRRHLPRP